MLTQKQQKKKNGLHELSMTTYWGNTSTKISKLMLHYGPYLVPSVVVYTMYLVVCLSLSYNLQVILSYNPTKYLTCEELDCSQVWVIMYMFFCV